MKYRTTMERFFPASEESDVARISALEKQNLVLFDLLHEFVENTYVPEKNCNCHISPPCRDCVDNSFMRELLETAKQALKAVPSHQHKR